MSYSTKLARFAGGLYLAIIVLGVWSDGLIRSSLIVAGDPIQTSTNLLAAPGSFRLSLAFDSIMVLCDVALAVALYFLLRAVSEMGAMLATAFRLVQAAILGVNLLNQHLALLLLTDEGLRSIEPSSRKALSLLFAEAQGYGYDLGLLFFGVNCIVTGLLVFRSGFLPRLIGGLIFASGPVYLVGSYLSLFAPHLSNLFQAAYAVPLIGEVAFCLWLIIKGVNQEVWSAQSSLSAR